VGSASASHVAVEGSTSIWSILVKIVPILGALLLSGSDDYRSRLATPQSQTKNKKQKTKKIVTVVIGVIVVTAVRFVLVATRFVKRCVTVAFLLTLAHAPVLVCNLCSISGVTFIYVFLTWKAKTKQRHLKVKMPTVSSNGIVIRVKYGDTNWPHCCWYFDHL
jgi:heme/copper-type cytochrome/quinol oxidase subunit 4